MSPEETKPISNQPASGTSTQTNTSSGVSNSFGINTGRFEQVGQTGTENEQKHIQIPANAIRTFQADVANLIKEKPISIAKIAIAEQTRKQNLPEVSINSPAPTNTKLNSDESTTKDDSKSPFSKNTSSIKPIKFTGGSVPELDSLAPKKRRTSGFLLFILTIALIAGSLFIIYYSYNKSPYIKDIVDSLPIRKFIPVFGTDTKIINDVPTDTVKPIQGTPITGSKSISVNLDANKSIKDIALSTYKSVTVSKNGNINVIFNKKNSSTSTSDAKTDSENTSDKFIPITTKDLLQLTAANPPRILSNTLSDNFSFGYVGEDKQPYLILHTSNFSNSYAGMLEWEKVIYDDVSALFSLPQSLSGTQSEIFKTEYTFKDTLVVSRDAREIQFPADRHLIYAFADNDTIIITTNTETLRILLLKLDSEVFIRQK